MFEFPIFSVIFRYRVSLKFAFKWVQRSIALVQWFLRLTCVILRKYFDLNLCTLIVGSLWSTEVGHHHRTSAKWVCVLISSCVCLLELTLYRQEKVLWHARRRLNQEDQVRFIKKIVWENIRSCRPSLKCGECTYWDSG